MSDYPAVDFETLAKKYKNDANEAEYRADQLEQIAGTLKSRLDAALEQLSDAHTKLNELTAKREVPNGPTESAVIAGETVQD